MMLNQRLAVLRPNLMVTFFAAALFLSTSVSASADTAKGSKAVLPPDSVIRNIISDRIDVMHKSLGMVVGISAPEGRRIISYGMLDQGNPTAPDGNTVFEIGSVTKVFTAFLLANMVRRGEVKLDDPVVKYLPPGTKLPERNGRAITLVDLATHTSGLPFLPTNMNFDYANYTQYSKEEISQFLAGYTDDSLYQFLSTYELSDDIGTKWAYSNLGMGLLGKALAAHANTDLETLIKERITIPLRMRSTAITVDPEMKERLSPGHDSQLNLAPEWNLPTLPGAGSLKSTANDLLTFLEAFIHPEKSPFAKSISEMFATRRQGPNLQQALGWWIIPFAPEDSGIVTFAGETHGYTCTIAYDPQTSIGVVVLSNSSENDGGLAWHLLRQAFPVETSASVNGLAERKEVSIDSTLLLAYVGKYQAPDPGGVISIDRDTVGLIFRSDGAPNGLRLLPESNQSFFVKGLDLLVVFQADSLGHASGIMIRFGGLDTPARRIESDSTKN